MRCKRTEPKPPRRLMLAAGQREDIAKDKFSFAARVGGADQPVRRAEKPFDDRELLPRPLVAPQC